MKMMKKMKKGQAIRHQYKKDEIYSTQMKNFLN
jgi:hypothetical protein